MAAMASESETSESVHGVGLIISNLILSINFFANGKKQLCPGAGPHCVSFDQRKKRTYQNPFPFCAYSFSTFCEHNGFTRISSAQEIPVGK